MRSQLVSGLKLVGEELKESKEELGWLTDFQVKAREVRMECEEKAETALRECAKVADFFGESTSGAEEVFRLLWDFAGHYDQALP